MEGLPRIDDGMPAEKIPTKAITACLLNLLLLSMASFSCSPFWSQCPV
jgi:hypothetical protein